MQPFVICFRILSLTNRSVIKINMSPRTKEQFEEIREQSTTRILNAALELFAEEGYDRTSISKIAKTAGVSKGLIYNYYKSKEELLKGLIISMMNEIDMSNLTPDSDKGNPKKILKNIVDFSFNFIQHHPRKMMLMTKLSLQISQFDFLHDMIKGKADFYFKMSVKLFKELKYKDPEGEAYILSLIMDGLAVQALSLKEKYWFEECKTAIYKKYDL